MARTPNHSQPGALGAPDPRVLNGPVFSQPEPTPDPTIFDSVTIDLAARRRANYTPNDLGFPAAAQRIRTLRGPHGS
jgi:hypothetical protein